MAILRTDIERALDELLSQEEGMRFQRLAVVLAKIRWPELIVAADIESHAPLVISVHGTFAPRADWSRGDSPLNVGDM